MQPEPYAKIGDIYRTQHAVLAGSRPDADVGNLPGKAVDMYRRSLMQNPMQSEVLLRLAAAYEIGGNTHAAMKTYHRALEVDPNNAFNYIRFGIFLRNIGDEVLAVEAFEKSAALSLREPIAIVNLRDLRRTDTKERK